MPGSAGWRSPASATGSREGRASVCTSRPSSSAPRWMTTTTGTARSSRSRASRNDSAFSPAGRAADHHRAAAAGSGHRRVSRPPGSARRAGRCGPLRRASRTRRHSAAKAMLSLLPSTRYPPPDQAVAEQPEHPVLKRVGEVDQHVAAEDQVRFAEHAVGNQVVVGEGDVALEPFIELQVLVARMPVVGQRMLAAGSEIVLRPDPRLGDREDALRRRWPARRR